MSEVRYGMEDSMKKGEADAQVTRRQWAVLGLPSGLSTGRTAGCSCVPACPAPAPAACSTTRAAPTTCASSTTVRGVLFLPAALRRCPPPLHMPPPSCPAAAAAGRDVPTPSPLALLLLTACSLRLRVRAQGRRGLQLHQDVPPGVRLPQRQRHRRGQHLQVPPACLPACLSPALRCCAAGLQPGAAALMPASCSCCERRAPSACCCPASPELLSALPCPTTAAPTASARRTTSR